MAAILVGLMSFCASSMTMLAVSGCCCIQP